MNNYLILQKMRHTLLPSPPKNGPRKILEQRNGRRRRFTAKKDVFWCNFYASLRFISQKPFYNLNFSSSPNLFGHLPRLSTLLFIIQVVVVDVIVVDDDVVVDVVVDVVEPTKDSLRDRSYKDSSLHFYIKHFDWMIPKYFQPINMLEK